MDRSDFSSDGPAIAGIRGKRPGKGWVFAITDAEAKRKRVLLSQPELGVACVLAAHPAVRWFVENAALPLDSSEFDEVPFSQAWMAHPEAVGTLEIAKAIKVRHPTRTKRNANQERVNAPLTIDFLVELHADPPGHPSRGIPVKHRPLAPTGRAQDKQRLAKVALQQIGCDLRTPVLPQDIPKGICENSQLLYPSLAPASTTPELLDIVGDRLDTKGYDVPLGTILKGIERDWGVQFASAREGAFTLLRERRIPFNWSVPIRLDRPLPRGSDAAAWAMADRILGIRS